MIRIDRETPWLIATALSEPVHRCLDDVARDWRRVFSTEPRIATPEGIERDNGEVVIAIGRDMVALLTGEPRDLGHETYELYTRAGIGSAAGRTVVCVDGGGMRGLIYAIYALSEHVLGVDPFWFWIDQRPAQAEYLLVDGELDVAPGPPAFRWRGWFCNDEDLLTGWAPSLQKSHGISLTAWDRVYETVLRTHGNFVVPGTFLFPHEPQIQLAAERGLAVGQHHIEVLGLNTYRWPDEIPYSFATHPEILIEAWREGVEAYTGVEVVWSIGYRGRHDRPFWYDDASSGDDDGARGDLISKAIATQVDIIRAVRPDDAIVLNLWMEGSELAAAGHLRIPDGVIVVWPDDGHGEVLDHGAMGEGEGIYYHTAMHDRIASQLTEMVAPDRIASELRRTAAAGATEHVLVNVSDVRPVVMTTAVAMELAWSPQTDVAGFLRNWARTKVGEEHADELVALWNQYFQAPWHYAPGLPDHLEDNAYQTFARGLIISAALGHLDEPYEYTSFIAHFPRPFELLGARSGRSLATALFKGTGYAQVRLDDLMAKSRDLLSRVAPESQSFVHDHLVTQVAIHQTSNRQLAAVCEGVLSMVVDDSKSACRALVQARFETLELLRILRRAERVGWDEWHRGEEFVNIPATLDLIDHLHDVVSGDRALNPEVFHHPADQYIRIKRYQESQVAGPRRLVGTPPPEERS